MHRKRINLSHVLAGQRVRIKEDDDGNWIVSFMHYDLGYIDLEQKTLQPPRQPVRPEVVTHVLGTVRHPSLRNEQRGKWWVL
jgi:hypothetical protein